MKYNPLGSLGKCCDFWAHGSVGAGETLDLQHVNPQTYSTLGILLNHIGLGLGDLVLNSLPRQYWLAHATETQNHRTV